MVVFLTQINSVFIIIPKALRKVMLNSYMSQQFQFTAMRNPSAIRLSTNTDVEPEVLSSKYFKIKTQQSPTLAYVSLQKINHINIPTNLTIYNSSKNVSAEPTGCIFKNSRTNIRQLYDFLKQQAMFIKQKDQVITNMPKIGEQQIAVQEFRQKMVRLLSLKSDKKSSVEKDEPLAQSIKKVNKIELPKIEEDSNKMQHETVQKRVKEILRNQSSTKKKSPIKNEFWFADHSRARKEVDIDERPLVLASSKRLVELRRNPEQTPKKRQSTNRQVVDMRNFRQKTKLSKLSLKVVLELSQKHSSKNELNTSHE